jgi:excisionase family DNA binding protein
MSERKDVPRKKPELLDVREIAEMLRLKPRTIYEMVGRKRIPFYKPAGTLLFDLEEILHWMKHGSQNGLGK